MPYRVLQLTDLHVFCEAGSRLKGVPTRESLTDVVDYILDKEAAFDAVIVTGDHTHDELPGSYQAVHEILSPWRDRLWQIPGNHDDRSIMRQIFGERITGNADDSIWFHSRLGEWSLIGLDSHWPGEVAGQIDELQMTWLKQQLSTTAASKIVLFIHHPPIDVGSEWMDAIGLNKSDLLSDVVSADRRISLVCCGHVHHEFEGRLHQAVVCATPSTGIQFNPKGREPNFAADPPGYRIIELDGQRFSSRVVRLPVAKYVPEND